jgi:Protein of unknown function (DUF3309)
LKGVIDEYRFDPVDRPDPVLILLLVGGLPHWGYSRNWGYRPSGGLGFVLVIVLVLVIVGRI